MSKHIIAIDLGTTNSVVSYMDGTQPKVIVNEEGERTTPSVIAWTDKNEVLVGQVARRQAVTNPKNTVSSVKRFMGTKFKDVAQEAQRMSYSVTAAPNGDTQIEVGTHKYAPPEISAKVLQKLKKAAENHLGESVSQAVITVPAYFDDAQRQATRDAGQIAGLEVLRIINEPTAAALAYGFEKKNSELIAVYDFGGGTFDVSVLEVGDGVVEVIATHGDVHLGGDDLDNALIHHLLDEFKKSSGLDVSDDKMVLQRLREAAEKAKMDLSSTFEADVNLPFLTADASGPKHLQVKLTRAKFEDLIQGFVKRTLDAAQVCLKEAGKQAADIDEIILVGGSTRVPLVQASVEEFFGKASNRSVNPDEVVSLGAGIQAGVLGGVTTDVVLLDVTPLSLGIETMGGVFTALIPRNTTIPTRKSEVFSTAADGQPQVEVHVLQGERKMSADNKTLGQFVLDGIPAAPRGTPQIEVTFDIDANGIVAVSAKDKASGKEQSVKIESSSGLSEGDIERMVKAGQEHAEADDKRRAEVEARNNLDQLVYRVQQTLSEAKDTLPMELGQKVAAALEVAKTVLNKADASAYAAAESELMSASAEMAEHLYKDKASTPTDAPPPQDEDVIDAEFTEAA